MSAHQTNFQYMLLMKATDWDKGLSPDEIQDGLGKLMGWIEDLRIQGTLLSGQPLYPEGRVITANPGKSIADGPFVESKEAVGGYLLILASGMDEAVEIAKQCPVLYRGLYIEVRPVAGQCPMMDSPEIQAIESLV